MSVFFARFTAAHHAQTPLYMTRFISLILIIGLAGSVLAQVPTRELSHSVYFASDEDLISAEQEADLLTFAADLGSYANYTLRIEAYTDEQGADGYNEALAKRRAAAVEYQLALRRIAPTATEVVTFGERKARRGTVDDNERRGDRRVDLIVTVTPWESTAAVRERMRGEMYQYRTIDNLNQPAVIKGDRGGRFLIPTHAVEYTDGTAHAGSVNVTLLEAYSTGDLLLAGLPTMSGENPLETGGSVFLDLTDSVGNRLQLKGNSQILTAILNGRFNDRMRIFKGVEDADGNVDWRTTDQRPKRRFDKLLFNPLSKRSVQSFVDQDSIWAWKHINHYVEGLIGPPRDVYRFEEHPLVGRYINANPFPASPSYEDPNAIRQRKINPPDTNAIETNVRGLEKLFTSKEEIAARNTALRQKAMARHHKRVERYERSLAFARQAVKRNEERRARYQADTATWFAKTSAFIQDFSNKRGPILYRDYETRRLTIDEQVAEKKAARDKAFGDLIAKGEASQSQADAYFFSINELGWRNIDCFFEAGPRQDVLAHVPTSTAEATVYLVPTDRRGALKLTPLKRESHWYMSGIPRQLSYDLFAFQVIDGRLALAQTSVRGNTDNEIRELTYAPVSPAELRERLSSAGRSK